MSFGQPVLGTTKRPAGQGCLSCVHNVYCRTFYWFLRFEDNKPDNNVGVQCASWSNNESDRITTQNDDDRAYSARLNDEGILESPQENGTNEGSYEGFR